MTDKQVANEIWRQMNAIDRNLVWCMGTKKPTIIKQGLQFDVSGYSFKGRVEVVLNAKDLYDVTLKKPYRHYYVNELYGKKQYIIQYTTHKVLNDVYFDDLMMALELWIENKEIKNENAEQRTNSNG